MDENPEGQTPAVQPDVKIGGRETFLDRLKRERTACQRKVEAYDNLINLVDGKTEIINAIDNLNNV